jgi:hypothetical protein
LVLSWSEERSNLTSIPVVVLSSSSSEVDIRKAREMGRQRLLREAERTRPVRTARPSLAFPVAEGLAGPALTRGFRLRTQDSS